MPLTNPLGNWNASPARRYLVALAVFVALAAVQVAVQPVLGDNAPLGLLVLAVMFAALFGGVGPALMVTALSVAAGWLLLPPRWSLSVLQPEGRIALGFFVFLALAMTLMGWLLQRAQRTSRELLASLQEREQTMRALLESTTQAVLGIDRDGTVRMANRAVHDVFGYKPDELIGQSSSILIDTDEPDPNDKAVFLRHCITASMQGRELRGRRKDGSPVPIETTFSMAEIRSGALLVSYVADITERKQAAEKLRQAAQHDPLTGLPNRALVYELGTQLLRAAARNQARVAVMFFDLDRFKPINDTYGHVTGDRMLQEVAQRLRSTVRASDLVGRLGGDEFIAILSDTEQDEDILHAATLLLGRLGEPYRIDTLELRTSPSIGIAVYPQDGADLETLIGNADAAMYHAKSQGRNTFQFFEPAIHRHAEQAFALEQRMRQSIERRDFELWYQPIIDTASMQVVGAEALIRWRQQGAPSLMPGDFIAAAEASGLINRIGDWVLEEACRQHTQWRDLGLPALRIAVNVSPLQFRAGDFAARIRELVGTCGVDPHYLELEVTEGTVMKQVEEAARILASLKDMGLHIALDDFGTGYSSLSYLSRLPIDKLKVDQSFIREIDTDARSLAIAETVIALAKKLEVEVVAEGIESDAALHLLRDRGCDLGQGYLISRPLQPEQFAQWYQGTAQQRQRAWLH